jgi:hypothetical protein
LIDDGHVLSVPLHGAGKGDRVADRDALEGIAALRKLGEPEVIAVDETVDEEVVVAVVPVIWPIGDSLFG